MQIKKILSLFKRKNKNNIAAIPEKPLDNLDKLSMFLNVDKNMLTDILIQDIFFHLILKPDADDRHTRSDRYVGEKYNYIKYNKYYCQIEFRASYSKQKRETNLNAEQLHAFIEKALLEVLNDSYMFITLDLKLTTNLIISKLGKFDEKRLHEFVFQGDFSDYIFKDFIRAKNANECFYYKTEAFYYSDLEFYSKRTKLHNRDFDNLIRDIKHYDMQIYANKQYEIINAKYEIINSLNTDIKG